MENKVIENVNEAAINLGHLTHEVSKARVANILILGGGFVA